MPFQQGPFAQIVNVNWDEGVSLLMFNWVFFGAHTLSSDLRSLFWGSFELFTSRQPGVPPFHSEPGGMPFVVDRWLPEWAGDVFLNGTAPFNDVEETSIPEGGTIFTKEQRYVSFINLDAMFKWAEDNDIGIGDVFPFFIQVGIGAVPENENVWSGDVAVFPREYSQNISIAEPNIPALGQAIAHIPLDYTGDAFAVNSGFPARQFSGTYNRVTNALTLEEV